MLWYKSWLDTRWQFLIGLAVVLCSAAATIFAYPKVLELLPLVAPDAEGEIGRRIQEEIALVRDYRGYVWSEWFRENLRNLATFFAVLLGVAGALTPSRGALFTLSLPISRRRLVGIHAATGLGELFLLTFIPSMMIPLLSPAIRQSYGIAGAAVHSICAFIAVSVFFSLALLLSTLLRGIWPPVLIGLVIAFALVFFDQQLFGILSGEAYFRRGEVPWLGLMVSAAASAAICYAAVVNFERRDF